MSFCDRCVRLLLAAILAPLLMSVSVAAAEPPATQYLLFQTLIGGPDPQSGVYHRGLSTPDVLQEPTHEMRLPFTTMVPRSTTLR